MHNLCLSLHFRYINNLNPLYNSRSPILIYTLLIRTETPIFLTVLSIIITYVVSFTQKFQQIFGTTCTISYMHLGEHIPATFTGSMVSRSCSFSKGPVYSFSRWNLHGLEFPYTQWHYILVDILVYKHFFAPVFTTSSNNTPLATVHNKPRSWPEESIGNPRVRLSSISFLCSLYTVNAIYSYYNYMQLWQYNWASLRYWRHEMNTFY